MIWSIDRLLCWGLWSHAAGGQALPGLSEYSEGEEEGGEWGGHDEEGGEYVPPTVSAAAEREGLPGRLQPMMGGAEWQSRELAPDALVAGAAAAAAAEAVAAQHLRTANGPLQPLAEQARVKKAVSLPAPPPPILLTSQQASPPLEQQRLQQGDGSAPWEEGQEERPWYAAGGREGEGQGVPGASAPSGSIERVFATLEWPVMVLLRVSGTLLCVAEHGMQLHVCVYVHLPQHTPTINLQCMGHIPRT
jgi:hypothetical protein